MLFFRVPVIPNSSQRGRFESVFRDTANEPGGIYWLESGLFEFSNGCLCCDLNEDLFDLLLELWKKRAEFDELIIATTGIADPANVALPFLTNPAIAAYRLTRIVSLADARLIEFQLADIEEARKQISFSDILLITKIEELLAETINRKVKFSGNRSVRHLGRKIIGLAVAAQQRLRNQGLFLYNQRSP